MGKIIKTRIPGRVSLSLALNAILLAEHNQEFKKTIKANFAYTDAANYRIKLDPKLQLLAPIDQVKAWARLDWLENRIQARDLAESEDLQALMAAYVQDDRVEVPQMLVVGFAAIAIPGITLGLFSAKKKVNMMVRSDILRKVNLKTSRHISRLSLGLLQQSLNTAGGDTGKLDPDTADWFYGDKEIEFFRTGAETLTVIKDDMKELGVPVALYEDEKGPAIMALSPVVNGVIAERYYQLDKIIV